MIQVRKLVLAIAAASAFHSGSVLALGLGEVTLRSALNQPLQADIELVQAQGLSASELIATLASSEAFKSAGLDRQHFLTGLKFTPTILPNGKHVIRVTSNSAVREPYLNFLVEVNWPNGRLLKEYTLLLDPPLYTPQPVVASSVRQAVTSAAPSPASAPVAAPAPAAARASVSANANRTSAPAQAAGDYRTSSSDTLWSVAQRVQGGSTPQVMLAIQDLNPEAFIGGNINLLKRGQVLRLPDAQAVQRRTPQEAAREVAEQNRAWASRTKAPVQRQIDATPRAVAGAAPAQAVIPDNLRLVGDSVGQSAQGGEQAQAENAQALVSSLAVAKESLDVSARENAELKERMADLQSQLEKVQRLVELKDDQLAKLQADLQAEPNAVAPEVSAPAEAPAANTVAEAASAEPAVAVEPEVSAPGAVAPEAPAQNSAETSVEPALVPSLEEPVTPVESEVAAQNVAPAPVDETQGLAPAVNPLDELLKNPVLSALAGGGAVLLLLLFLFLLSRRNARREALLQEQLQQMREQAPVGAAAIFSNDILDSAQEITESGSDALAEADVYIAYGRFNQAATLLENAINDDPQRVDLRLRLLEVYAELGDLDGFERHEGELREITGDAPQVAAIKAKYPSVFAHVAPSAVVAAAGVASFAEPSNELNLDDLELNDAFAEPSAEGGEPAFAMDFADFEAELQRELENDQLLDAPLLEPEAAPIADFSLDESLAAEPLTAEETQALHLHDLPEDDLEALQRELDASQGFDSTWNETASIDDLPSADDLQRELDVISELTADDSAIAQSAVLDENSPLLADLEQPAFATSSTEADEQASLDELLKDFGFDEPALQTNDALLSAGAEEANFALPEDFDLSVAEEEAVQQTPAADEFLAELEQVNAELSQLGEQIDVTPAPVQPFATTLDDEDEFDFLSGTDETATKLDLARAYADMGDSEGARDILEEVLSEGSDGQQTEARELLARLV